MGSDGQLGPLLKRLQGCDLTVGNVSGHEAQEALQDHLRTVVHEVLLGGQLGQVVLLCGGAEILFSTLWEAPSPLQLPGPALRDPALSLTQQELPKGEATPAFWFPQPRAGHCPGACELTQRDQPAHGDGSAPTFLGRASWG